MLPLLSRLITAALICLHAIDLYAQDPVISAPPDEFLAIIASIDTQPAAAPVAANAETLDLSIFEALAPAKKPSAAPAMDGFLSIIEAIQCEPLSRCNHPGCQCVDCDGATCRCGKPDTTKPPGVQQKLLNASGVMIQASTEPSLSDQLISTLDGIRERPRLVAGVANPTRQQAVHHLLTSANHRGKFTAAQLAVLTDQQILELHEADHDVMEGRRPVLPAAVTFATHDGAAKPGQVFLWTDGSSRNAPQPGKDYLTVGLKAKREQPQTVKQPAPQTTVRVQAKSRGLFGRVFSTGPRCVGGVCYQ